ncbi:hypothetical protein ACN42_g8515 [Penicillium freii]|uniref:Uncharacterized protein n=1 Tax=Penicillium freii TaxID=48697 RepID=A0A101MDM1_PENFR|nr:hypothetical protein ACN42_g8515 [Penicillium freii]
MYPSFGHWRLCACKKSIDRIQRYSREGVAPVRCRPCRICSWRRRSRDDSRGARTCPRERGADLCRTQRIWLLQRRIPYDLA